MEPIDALAASDNDHEMNRHMRRKADALARKKPESRKRVGDWRIINEKEGQADG